MKKLKKLFPVLMAVLMVVTVINGSVLNTAAEEEKYESTDAYVLNFDGKVTNGYKWQYFSPYYVTYDTYQGEDESSVVAFTMYNKDDYTEYFPVYCTDYFTGINSDSTVQFRRLNLEDSSYYANGAAGLLRSIVLQGFPHKSLDELRSAIEIENLTYGEVITATQAAIWSAAHGELIDIADFCSSFDLKWSSSDTQHYVECNAEIENGYANNENENLIESHIEAVFNYLMNLDPTPPSGITVSEASFMDWRADVQKKSDETYSITATVTVNVDMKENDALKLSVVLSDGTYASVPLSEGKNQYTIALDDVDEELAKGEILFAIDGIQTVADVFLFDAVGVIGEDQSLIGYADSQLPVHAEVSSTERILNIHKYSPVAGEDISGKTPLANVQFGIYYVGSFEDYVNAKLGIGSIPTQSEIEKYAVQSRLMAIVATDANGFATYNFGTEDGVYLVKELQTNNVIASLADPFYVSVPMTDSEGNYTYEVDVYPKNDVVAEDVDIDKDVTEIGNNSSTYDINEQHTWIIRSSIPAGIADGLEYVISDTLDYRLSYKGNMIVTVAETKALAHSEADEYVLIENVDYVIQTETVNDAAKGKIDRFEMSLTAEGMKKVARLASGRFADCEVRVYFDAVIDEDGELGVQIPNQAEVDYTNVVGTKYEELSDKPEVHTGGLQLKKVDANDPNRVLGDATFALARKIHEGEKADTAITVDGKSIDVVYVDFYNSSDFSAEKVAEVTTADDGKAVFYGLAYGEYYLIETKAPDGYNLLSVPVAVQVTEDSHIEDKVLVVENQAGAMLPSTGGMGTTIFYFVGTALVLVAVVLLVTKRRMKVK